MATDMPNFQANQAPALVKREIAAAGVGVCVVLSKAIFDVLGFSLDRHPNPHADVVRNFVAVRF